MACQTPVLRTPLLFRALPISCLNRNLPLLPWTTLLYYAVPSCAAALLVDSVLPPFFPSVP